MSLKTGSVKPKVTYREGRKLRSKPHPSRGLRRASPELLEKSRRLQDDGLEEIVVRWGMFFARRKPWAPRRRDAIEEKGCVADAQSIKKTLHKLTTETDAGAVAALRLVDEGTLRALRGAAFRAAKQRGEKFSLTGWRTWTPRQIREYAANAILRLPRSNGCPRVNELKLLFARELIEYWVRSTGKPAAVTKPSELYPASPFLVWATRAFVTAGVVITPQSLAQTLQRAKVAKFMDENTGD